ncbi:DUF3102 domain-containing protein [Paenibacillus sp. 1P03SA]|uniref:DUF3102 domain-containing protein n=1 Tax=Paenibacillus sp. 1P03SA TaxID=3132294 RepID=UPI0039A2D83C
MNKSICSIETLTAEIKVYERSLKESIAKHAWEIGKRLNEAKELLPHGKFAEWVVQNFEFTDRYAREFMKFHDQNRKSISDFDDLEWTKIQQVLSLPPNIDRTEFIKQTHTIPSTGESKTVDEMTTRELREVKKSLVEAERRAKETEELLESTKTAAEYWKTQASNALNAPPRVEKLTVEIIPEELKKEIEESRFKIKNLQAGYQEAAQKLKEYELRETVDFDEEQAALQRKKLMHEADLTTIHLRIHIKQFLEKAAIGTFMQGAIAHSNDLEKKQLSQSVEMLESYVSQIKAALNGRKLGGIINE